MRWGRSSVDHRAVLLLAVLAVAALLVGAKKKEPEPLPEDLPEVYRVWLDEIDVLITEEERAAFLTLEKDYQRASFVRRFWEERDPFPETRLNEFEENWRLRLQLAYDQFGGLDGDRAETLLLIGPPQRVQDSLCPQLFTTVSIWEYRNHPGTARDFWVVFVRGGARSADGYRLWSRFEGVADLMPFSIDPGTRELEALDRVGRECPRGRELQRMLEDAYGKRDIARLAEQNPQPSDEWVATFLGRLTTLPPGADSLDADFLLTYPGRRQNRTILQALLAVEPPPDPADVASRHFVVDGEVLRKGEPFESFRYRFDFPDPSATLPLVVQRYLRPGEYTLILRAQELSTDRYFRIERQISVPLVEATPTGAAEQPARVAEVATAVPVEPPEPGPFAEANEPVPPKEHRVRILPPPRELLLGRTRIEAIASGDSVRKVTFCLNGKEVLSKLTPPYSVELNLGESPRLHTIEAVAYDAQGVELARDEAELNSGPHRFGVRLIQPLDSKTYRTSLRIEAEVDLPEDERLDRVELFLGEERLATLYQPPFVQPIRLDEDRGISYVRAVAYLEDGNSTEDLVFINSPDNLDALEVDFVELYTSVIDQKGRPVEDLQSSDFKVLEDGSEQQIRRFERVRDLPLHAGVLLDTSTSMDHSLKDVERAALRFFERIVQPRDRAAVIVFSDFPELRVPLTNSLEVLAGGLVGLEADGETALYDSLIYGLYYFAGIRGKRALILLSDGADSNSRHNFDETLDFARRSGVAVYTIGLDLDTRDTAARFVLLQIARETGGRSFLVSNAGQLEKIYDSIEEELRSQYLIGYQSSQTEDAGFREVEVQVARAEVEAKTIPGYYP